jgi:Zn ribbon nucleic-acid-binding protein
MSGSGNRDYECLKCGYAEKNKKKKAKNCEQGLPNNIFRP